MLFRENRFGSISDLVGNYTLQSSSLSIRLSFTIVHRTSIYDKCKNSRYYEKGTSKMSITRLKCS